MGMFDEICCQAPLPDGFDAATTAFQTKSFPNPSLERYTITADGRLHNVQERDFEPDGYLCFYTSEEDAVADASNDPDAGWREYRARFCEGQLHSIVRLTAAMRERERFTHHGLASFRWFAPQPAGRV